MPNIYLPYEAREIMYPFLWKGLGLLQRKYPQESLTIVRPSFPSIKERIAANRESENRLGTDLSWWLGTVPKILHHLEQDKRRTSSDGDFVVLDHITTDCLATLSYLGKRIEENYPELGLEIRRIASEEIPELLNYPRWDAYMRFCQQHLSGIEI